MRWCSWWVPGVGVLLALPCLLESGLLRISRKLYGEIGPAFYGLRTKALPRLLREVRDVVGERGFWSEVQRVYENCIWMSLPSSLRIA